MARFFAVDGFHATDANTENVTATVDTFFERHTPSSASALSWRRNWAEVIPFFAFPDEVRRIIYTTNCIESLNAKLRRAVRTADIFPPMRAP